MLDNILYVVPFRATNDVFHINHALLQLHVSYCSGYVQGRYVLQLL